MRILFNLGQALATLGVFLNSKIVLYIGRIVFGLGGENIAVVCSTYASAWFQGQALNMAVGFQLSVVRFGSAASILILGPIYEAFIPDECTLNLTSTTVSPSTRPTMSPESTTTVFSTSITTDDSYCEDEESNALGLALAIAAISVLLSFLGSIITALMDKIRSKLLDQQLGEQPKVCYLV